MPAKQSYVRIDVNKDHIYHITDPVQLSKIFFPNEKANHRRASFLAIFFALRNASYQKLSSEDLNRLHIKHNINRTTFIKARKAMRKAGLIAYSVGWWKFSDGFKHSMNRLTEWIEAVRIPLDPAYRDQMEYIQIETAKVEKIYQQMRRRKRQKN